MWASRCWSLSCALWRARQNPGNRLQLWISCRFLCCVLLVIGLVLFCALTPWPPFWDTLLKAQTENARFPLPFLFVTVYRSTFWFLSHPLIPTQTESERGKDGWHISSAEAANIICNSAALISMFSNRSRDLYVLPSRASILTRTRHWSLSSTAAVSHDRCYSSPPSRGHMGLCQAWLILHSQLHSY